MRGVLPHKDLAWVALPAKIDLFGIDLVGNVDEEHIKEVVRDVIRLEDDLDFVGLVRWNCSLFWDEHERHLLPMVINAVHKAF